jgi:hypothetical protein
MQISIIQWVMQSLGIDMKRPVITWLRSDGVMNMDMRQWDTYICGSIDALLLKIERIEDRRLRAAFNCCNLPG